MVKVGTSAPPTVAIALMVALAPLAPRLTGAQTTDVPFSTHDGYPMFGRLTLPGPAGRYPVVVYVQTAEGATVDMKRPAARGETFNYYDLYREKLPAMDIAFFSYEGRGIRMGDRPPRYEQIDRAVYDTSTLDNKVRDVLSAVRLLEKHKNIDKSRIFLMGASEGTMLAAEAASRAPKEIKGLILYAVLATTLKNALKYMAVDGNYMALLGLFDTDHDGKITRQEFEADPKKIRERAMKGVAFETFDANGDGALTVEDMRLLRKPILDGIESENLEVVNGYLKATAVVSIPSGWVKDHFAHPPMWTYLAPLKGPVGLFHGSGDNLTPIEDVKGLEARANAAGMRNLQFHYFDGLDHSLGLGDYFSGGELPDGHKAIFGWMARNVRRK
jgi:pimeloyl-ACP methyl ester carboxylesterase